MISLKRLLDSYSQQLPQVSTDAYREALEAVAAGAIRCCPPTGTVLQQELSTSAEPLKRGRSARALQATHHQVLKSLRLWGEQSETYFARKTTEVKEMLFELAGAAESMGKRDQRYKQELTQFTENLHTISQLEDLSRMKTSLLRSAAELKSCTERMAREGSESVAQLEASLASHRIELEQAQELAALDPLTGLYNRREVEARIGRKLTGQTAFCVVIVDLNGFTQINDKHGHAAGDEVLRQIANELRMASRAQDILGRWGGDEFVLILDGNLAATKVKMQRMRPWVFGTYELNLAETVVKVMVSASVGIAEWAPGETVRRLISRADTELCRVKGVQESKAYS